MASFPFITFATWNLLIGLAWIFGPHLSRIWSVETLACEGNSNENHSMLRLYCSFNVLTVIFPSPAVITSCVDLLYTALDHKIFIIIY